MRAYPRERGATREVDAGRHGLGGLSPRARGNRCILLSPQHEGGPIPASAGQPPCSTDEPARHRAYPRERGATVLARITEKPTRGLSPRARGNRSASVDHFFSDGPIPASAGQPCCWPLNVNQKTAYPRERGATTPNAVFMRPAKGLSPRARGNRSTWRSNSASKGPIPASAGQPASKAAA